MSRKDDLVKVYLSKLDLATQSEVRVAELDKRLDDLHMKMEETDKKMLTDKMTWRKATWHLANEVVS